MPPRNQGVNNVKVVFFFFFIGKQQISLIEPQRANPKSTTSKLREATGLYKKRAKQKTNRPKKKLAPRICHVQTRKSSNKRSIHIWNYPRPIQKGAYDRVFQSNVGKMGIFEHHSIPFFPYCPEMLRGGGADS